MKKKWTIEEDKCIRNLYARLSEIGYALEHAQAQFQEISKLLTEDKNSKVWNTFDEKLISIGVMLNMTVKALEPTGRYVQRLVIEQKRAASFTGEIVIRRAKRTATKGGK